MAEYRLLHGDVIDMAKEIEPESVSLVCTSPPYAEQRKGQYGGIPESEYPDWTVSWCDALRPALRQDASILINIRPHLRDGQISDYTLRTRLALREAGWVECEEIIWYKPDGPPLGSGDRPRRAWESVHWFARTGSPFVNVKANGKHGSVTMSRTGRGVGEFVGIADTKGKGESSGRTRSQDLFTVACSTTDKSAWNDHPAQYPVGVPDWLIRMCCRPGGLVCDPFNGSGTTGVAALKYGCDYVGIDRDEHYLDISRRRLDEFASAGQLFDGF